MYISWWVYFVTGLSYVLQQPPNAGQAKTKADISNKSAHSCSSHWPNKTEKSFSPIDFKNEIERLCKVNMWFLFQTHILVQNRKRSSSFETGPFLDLKQTSNLKAGFPVYFNSAPIRIKLHKCINPMNAIWFMHTLYSALQTIEWFSKNFERAILFFHLQLLNHSIKTRKTQYWGGRIKSLYK